MILKLGKSYCGTKCEEVSKSNLQSWEEKQESAVTTLLKEHPITHTHSLCISLNIQQFA